MFAAIKLESQGGSGRNLIRIDPETGTGVNIGNMDQPVASLAFDSDGVLYAVTGDCAFGCGGAATPETLFTVNLDNASLTLFLTLGYGHDGEAIGFNPIDGMLYHMSGVGAGLIFEKIDLDTKVVTPVPLSGDPVGNYETIGFTFDVEQNQFVGSLIDCFCDSEDRSFFKLTPDGVLTHANTLSYWWKDYAFYEVDGSGIFLDLEALPNVADSGAVDLAVMVADQTMQSSAKVGGSAKVQAPGIDVYVRDGSTGSRISSMSVLDNRWRAIDLAAMSDGGANALVGVLAQRDTGVITVAVHRADNGSLERQIAYFNQNWVPSALAYVPDAAGPGASAFAVLAKNSLDNRVSVQLRRISDGSLINTLLVFRDIWDEIDLGSIDDISGNNRPEIMVVGQSDAGRIVTVIMDAATGQVINRVSYFGAASTPKAITSIASIGGSAAPELPLLAAKGNGRNTVQVRDATTDAVISSVYFFNTFWRSMDIGGLGDVNGNSAADMVVFARHKTKGTIQGDVRDAATGALITNVKFLGPLWKPHAFAVFPDITGNGIQELGVVAENDNGDIKVQLRDASTGVTVKTMSVP
jgi:hypothetical protein